MKAEADRRIAQMDAAAGTEKPPESAPVQKPEGASAAKESAQGGPAQPGNPPAAPDAVATEDYSFVPEAHRQFVANAPTEFRKYLRDWFGDYTKKTQAVSTERKAIEAAKKEIEFAKAVMEDQEALDALRAVATKRTGAQAPQAKPFDYTEPHTQEEWDTHFATLRKQAAEDALRQVQGQRQSETQAQAEFRNQGLAAKAAFVDTGEYTATEVDDLYERLAGKGVKFTTDNVVETLREFLPKKEPKKQDSPPATSAPKVEPSGASALTRGIGVNAPVNIPAFIRDGREPKTRDERLAEALLQVNQRRAARGLSPIPSS